MNDSAEVQKKEHVLAREVLKRRYDWELEAIAQDIINKLEMEVLTFPSIGSYLSNLLMSHPRTNSRDRAAETLMVSPGKKPSESGSLSILDPWKRPADEEEHPSLQQLAYWNMADDIINALARQGVHIPGE